MSEFWAYLPQVLLPIFTPHQLKLKYTLTVYQRPSQLGITLQAPMPTLMQLSTVDQPLFQGNHKPHVIEAFRFGQAAATFFRQYLSTSILLVHTQAARVHMYVYTAFIPQAVYTHISLYICIYSRAYIFTIVLWLLEGTTPPLPFTESVFPPKSQIMQTFCSAENLV